MTKTHKRVALGMSGGVDSSAAALLLQRQGYDVVGVTLLLCPDSSPDDQSVRDAAAVCGALSIPHHVVDLRDRFAETVIADFVSEYAAGRTPNPCIVCNRQIKFGAMLDYALSIGCDAVATGHFARLVRDAAGYARIVRDPSPKDQSYVLWSLTPRQLEHLVLPVSGYTKEELRALVQEAGLPVYAKPDSQDICFVPDGDYVSFLRRWAGLTPTPGDFIDRTGRVVGRHRGTIHYTVGQRKGLGGGFPAPMYVVKLDPERNVITLGGEGSQYASRMLCEQVNIHGSINTRQLMAYVKHRYSAQPASATITITGEAADGSACAEVVFDVPQRALTPGQSAVFYNGDMLLGGGIISQITG